MVYINKIVEVFILDLKKTTDELELKLTMNKGITLEYDCNVFALFTDEKENGWQLIEFEVIMDNFKLNNVNEVCEYMILNSYRSYLDLSCFNLSHIELRNRIRISKGHYYKIGYLSISENSVSYIIDSYSFKRVKTIKFTNKEYNVDYFKKNFFKLICLIGNVTMDGWMILQENYIYGVEDNKIKLKIENEFFYIDNLFLKFKKIHFNKKRFFNDDYDKLFSEVINYLNEYNKNIKIEKINSLENYIVNATVTLTIENIDKDFYFVEEPFKIEVPYDFDSFIKSKTIIKILKGRIRNHYKVWEGNIYKFEIEYNGRKEILYL